MKILKLSENLIPDFKEYYAKYSHEQDESFPPVDDFTINENDPVYLLVNGKEIRGAAALMLHPEYREVRQARLRMFHAADGDYLSYLKLLNSILLHTHGLTSIYGFIEDNYSHIAKIWEDLGFNARRFAWVLIRHNTENKQANFPAGYELKTFRENIDEDSWCAVINDAFGHSLGHVRMTPEKIRYWKLEKGYLQEGMKLLWYNDKPVGSIGITKDNHKGSEIYFIDAVAVINDFQGKGLGKNLLRAGIEFAVNSGIQKVMLSVNGENDKAADMYFREGFEKEALYKCFYLDIK